MAVLRCSALRDTLRFATYLWFAELAVIDGSVGVIFAPLGKVSRM
jgi:hypothetical protein